MSSLVLHIFKVLKVPLCFMDLIPLNKTSASLYIDPMCKIDGQPFIKGITIIKSNSLTIALLIELADLYNNNLYG